MADTTLILAPVRSTLHGRLCLAPRANPLPSGWEPIADIERAGRAGGVLLRNRETQRYALWDGSGSIRSLPQARVKQQLAKQYPKTAHAIEQRDITKAAQHHAEAVRQARRETRQYLPPDWKPRSKRES